MKQTNFASFDTIRVEGTVFVIGQLEKALAGAASSQLDRDYAVPRGFRLTDELGRAFQIAQSIWNAYAATSLPQAAIHFAKELLRDAFGYANLKDCDPPHRGGKTYPIWHMAADDVPLVILPMGLEADTPDERFAVEGSGVRRKSGTQMLQEYLNAGGAAWGIVLGHRCLRLLRASNSLVRPAWLEFDLETILGTQRYPDFCALYRVMHASRAPRIWQQWWEEGTQQGVRVREGLRKGVTTALQVLGSGFLAGEGEGNATLRTSLEHGTLTKEAYYTELLRLIYRLLFLFTAEERGILFCSPKDAQREAHELYERGYSCARLRDLALRRANGNRHVDLWEGMKVVFRALADGEPALDLPALGGLFGKEQCPHLDTCLLSNRALLEAIYHLRWTESEDRLLQVDYRNMGPEELGSVYESLLELVPSVDLVARRFSFIGIDEGSCTAGNARKTTGSYYTPESLVHELIRTTLDPVVEHNMARNPNHPAEAILATTVCDPACGSGHFLLAAGRRLAERLASVRSTDGIVTPADYRHALREVVSHCLYGVDLNPMAVELARTALWLEGHEPGKPLSFLDHHIRCGNSLVGVFDLTVLEKGVPPSAYKPLTGDDPEHAARLKKRNNAELKEIARGQNELFGSVVERTEAALTQLHWRLEAIAENTLDDVDAKRRAYQNLLQSQEYRAARFACDLWTSAFFAEKKPEVPVPTTADVARAARSGSIGEFSAGVDQYAAQLSERLRFFHWKLEFPEVFARGGFDCVLGNPPWERVKLQEEEFFAFRAPSIAHAPTKAVRDRMIAQLAQGSDPDQALYRAFLEARRIAEAISQFVHCPGVEGGRYPLTGTGDVNLYALFAELFLHLHRSDTGRAGFIVPSGIASDNSTKDFFAEIATRGRLVSLYDFENRDGIFPSVHRSYKFSLLTLGAAPAAEFAFFLHQTEDLQDARRRLTLSPDDFRNINPNTLTCPVVRSAKDAEIAKRIYSRVPVLWKEARDGSPERNPWGIKFASLFHMANDSHLFHPSPGPGLVPLYEAKLIHQFDHRFATFDPQMAKKSAPDNEPASRDLTDEEKADPHCTVRPRYWVDQRDVIARLADAPTAILKAWRAGDAGALRTALEAPGVEPAFARLARHTDILDAAGRALEQRCPKWLMGWRDITNATNERTTIASVLPRVGVGNNLPLIIFSKEMKARYAGALVANFSAIVLDYVARNKIGGTHLNFFVFKQLPILPPDAYTERDLAFIIPRVFELTWTAYDISGWAEDLWNSMELRERALVLGAHRTNRAAQQQGTAAMPFIKPECMPPVTAPELDMSFSPDRLPPFPYHPARRAYIRAELDAWFARLYGLSRDDLRYILDPEDVMGSDYPSETFRVLKENELKRYGEYRTRRLVLEAWDAQAEVQL